jgi:hypothetical protein
MHVSFDSNVATILACIALSGLFSGYTSFLWRDKTPDVADPGPLKFIALSLLAAATVPLFLQTISSQLLENSASKPVNYIVFGGLCLLAGFSAPQYVKRLTSKIFDEVSQVKKAIERTEAEVELNREELRRNRDLTATLVPESAVEPDDPADNSEYEGQ